MSSDGREVGMRFETRSAMRKRYAERWFVTCLDHRAGPFRSREAAQRRLDEIKALGACQRPHYIEHYVRSPE